MKILIAEDNPASRRMLQKFLEKDGHEVFSADNGLRAWEILNRENLSMVVTDWVMPEMDGLSLCRKIREVDLSRYVYIIILTSKDEKEDSIEGLVAGADDYITKPVDPKTLKARIRAGQRIVQLEAEYKKTSAQLLQSEKMASIGQLAAGVAHEINNPVGFISSNLTTLGSYLDDLMGLIEKYRELTKILGDGKKTELVIEEISKMEEEVDLEFILSDLKKVIEESREGTQRVKKIVSDLKDFSHVDEADLKYVDINQGLESTLNIVWNELKYKADVVKNYGDIPLIECYPQQINQVFMNLLVNAAQAIEDRGEIKISTGLIP